MQTYELKKNPTVARRELLKRIAELSRVLQSNWIKDSLKKEYQKKIDKAFSDLAILQ